MITGSSVHGASVRRSDALSRARLMRSSVDWKAVEVTPVIPFNQTKGMTLAEILTFWTMGSRDKVRYWRIAPVSPISSTVMRVVDVDSVRY